MSSSSHAAEPQLNATPLIDVLLVLIVMMVITLPIATHNVTLNLPQGPQKVLKQEVISLEIDFDGALFWNGKPVESIAALEERLKSLRNRVPAPFVQVRPDPRARYEAAAQVLAATQRAHVQHLSILQIAETP